MSHSYGGTKARLQGAVIAYEDCARQCDLVAKALDGLDNGAGGEVWPARQDIILTVQALAEQCRQKSRRIQSLKPSAAAQAGHAAPDRVRA